MHGAGVVRHRRWTSVDFYRVSCVHGSAGPMRHLCRIACGSYLLRLYHL